MPAHSQIAQATINLRFGRKGIQPKFGCSWSKRHLTSTHRIDFGQRHLSATAPGRAEPRLRDARGEAEGQVSEPGEAQVQRLGPQGFSVRLVLIRVFDFSLATALHPMSTDSACFSRDEKAGSPRWVARARLVLEGAFFGTSEGCFPQVRSEALAYGRLTLWSEAFESFVSNPTVRWMTQTAHTHTHTTCLPQGFLAFGHGTLVWQEGRLSKRVP